MRLTLWVAVEVVCVYYLCIPGVFYGRSFAETLQDGDIANAGEEDQAPAGRSSRMHLTGSSWPRLNQEGRSLRNVYVSPDTIGNAEVRASSGGGGWSCSGAVLVLVAVLSGVVLVILVAILVFWCCRKNSGNDHSEVWRLLGSSFKRRSPGMDEEEQYTEAKRDTAQRTGY